MRLNPLFSDHMVLQAKKPVRVFGTGAGHVAVRLGDARAEADVRAETWCLELPARDYGGPVSMSVQLDGGERLLRDVYFGDVYLLAGQSNMQFKLAESAAPRESWAGQPLSRLFSLERPEAGEPFRPGDGWQVCARERAGDWPAIGYHLGQLLAGERAVGLIACYQGASVIESWLPEDEAARPEFAVPPAEKHIDHAYPDYAVWNRDGYLYRHMFAQIVPFPLRAVVWYQGESDTTEAEARVYDRELARMIARWRGDLRDGDLPFVLVQIADYLPRGDAGWRALQEAQARAAAAIPAAALVRSADVCEADHIHPATKSLLAARIADALRALPGGAPGCRP